MIKIVNEQIGFHYLLNKMQLYTLILLEWNIFPLEVLSKSKHKSITQSIFIIQDNKSI